VATPPDPESPAPLEELQEAMAIALQRADALVGDAAFANATVTRRVAGNLRLNPVEQLEIYREQFWFRHEGALREDFPSLVHVLGDDGFEALSRAYLARHPPRSFTLRDLGERLCDFVRAEEPWRNDPLLGEIAELEWAFVEAFDAPDATRLDVGALATATEDDWERARLTFQPSLRRLALRHPVHELRGQVRAGEDPPRPGPRDSWIVIYRAGLGHEGSTADFGTLQYIEVEPQAYRLLGALAAGARLAAACEEAAAQEEAATSEELAARVGAWFQTWAAYGWISRVDFAAESDERAYGEPAS